MQDRGGVLQLAVLADDRGLAVALRLAGPDPKGLHALVPEEAAEFLADGDQRIEVLVVAAGAGIGDDRDRQRAARRRLDAASHLDPGFVDLHDQLADIGTHGVPQRSPFHCEMPAAARPPTRAWTRPPAPITRMKTISSASGAPGTRTGIAS